MEIDKSIRAFAAFLDNSWLIASQLLLNRSYTSNEDSINDWLQANWELLVERKVLEIDEYLEVYGDGADYNGASSRITNPEAMPSFRIVVASKRDSEIFDILNNESVTLGKVMFDKLVGFKNGFYLLEPDFNHVMVIDSESGLERVFALNDVYFVLERV